MKLTIDTDKMTIEIHDEVSFDDLFTKLSNLFPDEEWKKYKLISRKEFVDRPFYPTNPSPSIPTNPWEYPTNPYVEPLKIVYDQKYTNGAISVTHVDSVTYNSSDDTSYVKPNNVTLTNNTGRYLV